MTGTGRSASRTPARSPSARGPTWSPSTSVSPRTAGTAGGNATVVFAATAADVVHVVADGVVVATADDRHDVGAELDRAIRKVWEP